MRIPAVPPNWFTSVMGTGALATASAALPIHDEALTAFSRVAWVGAAIALVVALIASFAHYRADAGAARRYLFDVSVAPFFGAPPMAILTVGAATLTVGEPLLGAHAAYGISASLWLVGTILGLASAVVVPAIALTTHQVHAKDASAVWLMPVVPPMVSAATGALLIPQLSGMTAHLVAIACYAMFAGSGLAALVIIAALLRRLVRFGAGERRTIPTLFIVLGVLGQSTTALGLLADRAGPALGISQEKLTTVAVAYGIPVLGLAMLWLAFAAALTIRAARVHLPFTLAWWAFTFPVGTCATGASTLAHHTGVPALTMLAVGIFTLLETGWLIAATGTVSSWLRTPQRVSERLSLATQPGPSYTNAV